MSFKGHVNNIRRRVMRGLTHYAYRLYDNPKGNLTREEVKRILVCRPNSRLGNQLLITPLIQELSDTFPNASVDLFVRGNLASILFERYENVDKIIKLPPKPFKELRKYLSVWLSLRKQRYDFTLNVASASSSGRLSACFARARFKFPGNPAEDTVSDSAEQEHIAKKPVYALRKALALLGIADTAKPVPEMDIKLSPQELANGKKIMDAVTLHPEKDTVCIYTYATGGKCYPKAWWNDLYERLSAKYAGKYNIVEILPKENVSQIDFKALAWYSLDIREMTAAIASTKAFISADCGIMHLASAAHVPTAGLFSSTNINSYRPYNKGSIAIDTNKTGLDEIIRQIAGMIG
jgi:ADP-heptose:LPS heptosyltransferase